MKQILFTIILFFATTASAMAAEWTKLGSRNVDFKVDRDTIKVGKDEGLYKAIKIDVDRGGLQMYDIKVTFGDGSSFSPDTRIHFKKGSLSRTIDLPGEARIIRKINFVYKSKGKRKQKLFKTKVHVYGKKAVGKTGKKKAAQKLMQKKFPNWTHIGSRRVSPNAEKDSISAIEDGVFRSFRFYVTEGDVEMYNIVVHFANGKKFSPETRFRFDENTRSRDIDLPGKKRKIVKIDFYYRSQVANDKAKLHVYGKK